MTLQSPLIGLGPSPRRELTVDGRQCTLAEVPFMDMVNLRGDAGDARFVEAVRASTGLSVPVLANQATLSGARQLIWLGPDEWLLKDASASAAAQAGPSLANALRNALSAQQNLHCSVVDVGSGNTTFTLQGPACADLLSRGCPLDLHPRAFATGAVAQSHIARSAALIRCVEAGRSYEITVRRSFADYLFRWLCEAGLA